MRIPITSVLSDAPEVLARQIGQQPEHEPADPTTGLHPDKPASHPIQQPVRLGPPPARLGVGGHPEMSVPSVSFWVMDNRQVTAGLAEFAPGPGLCAALSTIDLSQVSNGEIITVLRAWSRLRAHIDAHFLTVVAEVGRRDPDAQAGEVARLAEPTRYGADETRLALAWTRRAAEVEHDFAELLVHRLPLVHAELGAGRIDRPKARAFYDHLADLPTADIERICRALLPKAGELTTGQLRARLARMVIAADPDRARDQYEKAVSERLVVGYLNPDGTAVITAEGLPPDQAAAACERIDQLARAAKRAGHPGRLDQVRAEVFLGLLDGRYHNLTRDQIITELLRSTAGPESEPASPTPTTDVDDRCRQGAGGDPNPVGRPTGIEIHVELATLLGCNERPGQIPGWGPVGADVARRLVARQRRAQWRFAVTDEDGYLLYGGITRRRPADSRDASEGGILELHVPATLLGAIAANPPPGWAGVINDIAEQYATWPQHHHELDSRPTQRLPHAALRRHTQIRDRTCRGPGCRRPATKSEYDHTRDYQLGGDTVQANGDPLCDHDHDLKTKGGWKLRQPEPGTFIWHTPLGQIHRSRGDPIIIPLPEPEDDDPPF